MGEAADTQHSGRQGRRRDCSAVERHHEPERFGVGCGSMFRAESKHYGIRGARETRQAGISVDVLDTERLKAGKMSSCVKGRSSLFLKFRIPSQGTGTVEPTKINLSFRFEEREENC